MSYSGFEKLTGEAKDLAYMKEPRDWTRLYCPIKRRDPANPNGPPETAYLIDDTPTIFIGNIFNVQLTDKKVEYANHESIVRNGWRAD